MKILSYDMAAVEALRREAATWTRASAPWRGDPYARKQRKRRRARPYVTREGVRVQPPSRRALQKSLTIAIFNIQYDRQRKLELALRGLGVPWRKYTSAVSRRDGAFLKPLWAKLEEIGHGRANTNT